jgi:hypothetical protein
MQPLTQFLQIPNDEILRIVLLIAVLLVLWAILRFVLRMAMRAFSIGCLIILLLGAGLILMRVLN